LFKLNNANKNIVLVFISVW